MPDAAVVTVLDNPNGVQPTGQLRLGADHRRLHRSPAASQSETGGDIRRDLRRQQHAVRRRRRAGHPGRRHLRPRQRAQPADHRQRDRGQQRLLRRRHPHRHAVRRQQRATPAPSSRATRSASNGGTNLAGGIGIFDDSDGYQVVDNAICGNFSGEYGGAVSAFGYQGNPGRQHARWSAPSAATGSGSTGPTTRAAASWSPASCQPTRRSSRRAAARSPSSTTSIAGQPGQRRRRRHPAADDERLAHLRGRNQETSDPHRQQHHREQRLGPRGWRHRPRRRGLRATS